MRGTTRLKLLCATALIGLMALGAAAPAGAELSGEGAPLSPEAGNIRGTVTDAGGAPVEHLEVCAMSVSTDPVGLTYCTRTEEGGQYLIYNARKGDYKVYGEAPWYLGEEPAGRENHPQVWYPGAEHPDDATAVAVAGESTTTGIDFQVHEGGEIVGTVTDETTGAPVSGIRVCPVWVGIPQRGEDRPCGFSDAAGHYTVKDVDTDEYTLQLDAQYAPGYQSGTYSTPGASGPTVVSVTAGTVTAGIDPQVRRATGAEGPAGEGPPSSAGPSPSPPTSPPPAADDPFLPPLARPHLVCRRGLHKARLDGRVRCVERGGQRQDRIQAVSRGRRLGS